MFAVGPQQQSSSIPPLPMHGSEALESRAFQEGSVERGIQVGGQTRVDLATLAFFPCFVGVFRARKRRKSH